MLIRIIVRSRSLSVWPTRFVCRDGRNSGRWSQEFSMLKRMGISQKMCMLSRKCNTLRQVAHVLACQFVHKSRCCKRHSAMGRTWSRNEDHDIAFTPHRREACHTACLSFRLNNKKLKRSVTIATLCKQRLILMHSAQFPKASCSEVSLRCS